MKLNNKGFTLIELLITIVFIGIVLVFMFGLLNDLRNETENNDFAFNNQVNKIDAVHTIEKDLTNYTLTGVKDVSSGNIKINFYFLKGSESKTSVLSISKRNSKYYLNYTNVEGEKNSWEMKDAEVDTCGKFTLYKEETVGDMQLNNYYFKLNIYLYNSLYNEKNNKNNNNVIDDIEITYSGYISNLSNNTSYLTSGSNGQKNIGTGCN